jgi:hypothetical protein
MGNWKLALLASGICGALGACGDGTDGRRGASAAGGQPMTDGAGGAPGTVAPPPGGGASLPPGSTIFAVSYGDEGQQTFGGMTTDGAGDVYAAGVETPENIVTLGPTGRQFGPVEGTMKGAFVVKYGPTGELLWRQPFPFDGDNFINLVGVALQPSTGAVILAGWVNGSVTLDDGTTLTSGTDPRFGLPTHNVVLIALDTAGYLVWSRLYPSPFTAEPDGVFVAANGDIELVGRVADNGTVGGGPICCLNTPFGLNSFAARYAPRGEPIWSVGITGGEFSLMGAGGAPDGGLVVGGSVSGTFTFDGQTFSGGMDLPDLGLFVSAGVVLRIKPDGHLDWSRVYQGAPRSTSRVGAAFDAATNVILYGQFNETLDLGNGVTIDAPADEPLKTAGFLAKLAPDGTAQWAHQFAFADFDTVEGRAVAADAAGNIALGGTTAGGLSLGGPAPLPAGTSGDFIAKFTAAGAWVWDRGFAVTTSDDASRRIGVGFDQTGAASMAGEFDNTVDFGTGPLTAPGQTHSGGSALPRVPDNLFLLRLAP